MKIAPPETQRLLVLKALIVFAASRAVILTAILFATAHMSSSGIPGTWNASTGWWHWLLRWDSGYYLSIAQNGYTYDGNPAHFQSVVFFPGYPILIRGFALTFGLTIARTSVLVSNLCSCAAILAPFRLVKSIWDADAAMATVATVSFFPASLFLSTGYSEGLALLLTVAFFSALFRRRFALAVLCAGCMSAVRPAGVLLVVPLVWEIREDFKRRFCRRFLTCAAGAAAGATSGLFAFAIFCWICFHDPLLFIHARGAWALGRAVTPGATAWKQLNAGAASVIWPDYSDAWAFLVCAAILVLGWNVLPLSMRLYSAAVLFFLVVTRVLGPEGFVSENRYLLLLFRCFIATAVYLARRVWSFVSVVAGMAVFLFIVPGAVRSMAPGRIILPAPEQLEHSRLAAKGVIAPRSTAPRNPGRQAATRGLRRKASSRPRATSCSSTPQPGRCGGG